MKKNDFMNLAFSKGVDYLKKTGKINPESIKAMSICLTEYNKQVRLSLDKIFSQEKKIKIIKTNNGTMKNE